MIKSKTIAIWAITLLIFLGFLYNVTLELKGKRLFCSNYKELAIPFDSCIRYISLKSAFPTSIKLHKDSLRLFYSGTKYLSITKRKDINLSSIDNASFKVALFSLSYVRDALREDSLSRTEIDLLNKLTLAIIKYSNRLYQSDKYIFNDHAVSERLEALILYTSYLSTLGNYKDKLWIYRKHISQLAELLSCSNYFSYNGNHGLMQLRAILTYKLLSNDTTNLNIIVEQIEDILPIYFADDGSILESSTGYNLYIYNQFKSISELLNQFNKVQTKRIKITLDEYLSKAKEYFRGLVTMNGFLQGLGDSYNLQIDNQDLIDSLNYIYCFGNGLAGFSHKTETTNYSLLFVSFDNQPNIHKLPEDLSIYLFYNQPFFINSGVYSYERLDTNRRYILSPKSQNGIYFNDKELDSSLVSIVADVSDNILFKGVGYSEDYCVERKVRVDKNYGVISIQDSATNYFVSRFIIHPDIIIKQMDRNSLMLIGNQAQVFFQSEKPFHIDTSWVASGYMKKTKVQRINFYTQRNKIRLEVKKIQLNFDKTILGSKYRYREIQVDKLKNKYSKSLTRNRYLMLVLCVNIFVLLIYSLLQIFLPIKMRVITNYFMCLIIILLVVDLFYTKEMIILDELWHLINFVR